MDINGIIEGLERQGFWRVTVAQPATSAQDSESGADAESKDSLRAQLDMAEKALAVYEQKAAGHTTLTIPAPLVVNLEEMREKVARLGEELSE